MMNDCKRGVAKNRDNQAWVSLASVAPNRPGVYTVWRGDECLYVGSSKLVRQRLIQGTHAKKFAPYRPNYIAVMPCADYRAKESELISHLGPTLNAWRPKGEFELRDSYVCSGCKQEKIAGLFVPCSIRLERPFCISCQKAHGRKYRVRLPDGVPTHDYRKDPSQPPVLFGHPRFGRVA